MDAPVRLRRRHCQCAAITKLYKGVYILSDYG